MARFLSPEWFDDVRTDTEGAASGSDAPAGDRLVLRQVVRATPDGDVVYHVTVEAGCVRILPPGEDAGSPDLTITTDWDTAAAIAQGKVAAQAALIEGRLRVKGNLAAIASHAAGLPGLDPVSASARDRTTY